ncbi:MAG: RHS repeat protein [Phycisphaerales bacterium]|nr:RHS repeat protein [Phycisphaerales bacterium]
MIRSLRSQLRDHAGRVVLDEALDPTSNPPAVLLTTEYSYEFPSGGGSVVTVERPDTSTETTESYRDGRVKSVTGSAGVARYYEYGVSANREQWTTVRTGSENSPRYETTVVDWLGRVARTIRPGFGNEDLTTVSMYNDPNGTGAGQLRKTYLEVGAGMIGSATLYEYDALGGVSRSGLDVDGDDLLDTNSLDRISKTVVTYVTEDGGLWRKSATLIYGTDANGDPSGTAIATNVQLERLSGFSGTVTRETKSRDIFGNETITTVDTDRANKIVTETVNVPDSNVNAVRTLCNGLLVEETSPTGVNVTYEYDGLGRRTKFIDGRGKSTTTTYDALGRVETVTDPNGAVTAYAYYDPDGVGGGRLKWIKDPNDSYTRYAYDGNIPGQPLYRVWGDVPQPMELGFNAYGERTSLKTYRNTSTNWSGESWPTSPGAADQTTWIHDGPTGLLTQKQYADSKTTDYNYTPDGRMLTRTWARGNDRVETAYSFDPSTLDLVGITYNHDADVTPGVTIARDRLGRPLTTTDAAGTRTHAYDPNWLVPLSETYDGSSLLPNLVVSRGYEPTGSGNVPGRMKSLGASGLASYAAEYRYRADGRLDRVVGPGLPGSANDPNTGAQYAYIAGTDVVGQLEYRSVSTGGALLRTTRMLEPNRDLIDYVENIWRPGGSSATISKYDYSNDALRAADGRDGHQRRLRGAGSLELRVQCPAGADQRCAGREFAVAAAGMAVRLRSDRQPRLGGGGSVAGGI